MTNSDVFGGASRYKQYEDAAAPAPEPEVEHEQVAVAGEENNTGSNRRVEPEASDQTFVAPVDAAHRIAPDCSRSRSRAVYQSASRIVGIARRTNRMPATTYGVKL